MKVELLSTLLNHNCQQIGYVQAVFPMLKSCGVCLPLLGGEPIIWQDGYTATQFILEVNVPKASSRYPSRGPMNSWFKFKYIEKIPHIMTVYLNLIILIKMISLVFYQPH